MIYNYEEKIDEIIDNGKNKLRDIDEPISKLISIRIPSEIVDYFRAFSISITSVIHHAIDNIEIEPEEYVMLDNMVYSTYHKFYGNAMMIRVKIFKIKEIEKKVNELNEMRENKVIMLKRKVTTSGYIRAKVVKFYIQETNI